MVSAVPARMSIVDVAAVLAARITVATTALAVLRWLEGVYLRTIGSRRDVGRSSTSWLAAQRSAT